MPHAVRICPTVRVHSQGIGQSEPFPPQVGETAHIAIGHDPLQPSIFSIVTQLQRLMHALPGPHLLFRKGVLDHLQAVFVPMGKYKVFLVFDRHTLSQPIGPRLGRILEGMDAVQANCDRGATRNEQAANAGDHGTHGQKKVSGNKINEIQPNQINAPSRSITCHPALEVVHSHRSKCKFPSNIQDHPMQLRVRAIFAPCPIYALSAFGCSVSGWWP